MLFGGYTFPSLLAGAYYVAACVVTLCAARYGSRAENRAAAALAWVVIMLTLLAFWPDATDVLWRKREAARVGLELGLGLYLSVLAVRWRRPLLGAAAATALATAFGWALVVAFEGRGLPMAAHAVLSGLRWFQLVALAMSTLEFWRERRHLHEVRPAGSRWAWRGLRRWFSFRGRLDRRGYVAGHLGITAAALALMAVGTASFVVTYVLLSSAAGGVVFAVFTLMAFLLAPLAIWLTAAIAVRRLRDFTRRPVVILAALWLAGVAERLLTHFADLEHHAVVSSLAFVVLALWPGRRTDDARAQAAAFA